MNLIDITYKTVRKTGYHLVGIGLHIEIWKYGKDCMVFEDGECLGGFSQNGKDDWDLIGRAIVFYYWKISPKGINH